MKDVAVLGVGMHRFGMWADRPNKDMLREAGSAAMKDAGLGFRDVGTAYVGYIFDGVMSGTRAMKEFGLTGIPILHVEAASATASRSRPTAVSSPAAIRAARRGSRRSGRRRCSSTAKRGRAKSRERVSASAT